MSGHSKWATIKRSKEITDKKKSAIFTKLANLITIAARKGSDPETNFSLRIAIDKAKKANMPKENIERAIKRFAGDNNQLILEECLYEGIGPVQSQFIIKIVTNSKNRSTSEIRHLFSKYNGSLGSVMWNFKQQGVIKIKNQEFKKHNLNLEEFELDLVDLEVEDIQINQEEIIIFTKMEDLEKIKNFLESKNIFLESVSIEYVAKEKIEININEKERLVKFIEELEQNEDVIDYYHNLRDF